MRIVSLIASSTEIAFALGLGPLLVGRSHECDWPEAARSLPRLSEPKFLPDGKSYEIDQKVRAIVQEGLSVYRVDAAKLRDLRPDVILTQIQCEVCAVSAQDVEAALCEWTGAAPRVVSLNPNRLDDVWADIRRVATACEVEPRGEALVEELRTRMAVISSDAARAAAARGSRPRVACIEWIEPLMSAGNWMPELIRMAGGEPCFGKVGEHSPMLGIGELVAADPDWIVVTPCGFDIGRTLEEMPALHSRPEWKDLRAVREGRVAVVDGNAYMNRPGPRLVESLEILAEILNPETFRPRFLGRSGWELWRAASS